MSEKFLALVSLISCMTGKVVMDHVLLEYHIKVKKSGGAFKIIPAILMHYYNGILDSDLKESKDKKKVVCEPRLQARLAKSIAK